MLTFPCPACGKSLQVAASVQGQPIRCPFCKVTFTAPRPEPSTVGSPNAGEVSVGPLATTLPAQDLAIQWLGEPPLRPGASDRTTFPGYEVLELLGRGGMGEVYKARQLRLDRLVALKVMRPNLIASAEAARRFQREAQAAARLAHPNIVTIHDAAEANGRHFLVMEFVEGTDLGSLVKSKGPLPVPQACDYIRQAALGLQHAHERGLVHRDIKPSNLLVTKDGGVVKVLDMGLVRLEATSNQFRSSVQLTRLGMLLGTPAYLAPEQAQDPRCVDARADIYSLGCSLYHLLAGRPPFTDPSAIVVIQQHQAQVLDPLEKLRPDLPGALAEVVQRMMAPLPEDRFPSAAAVATALTPFCRPPMALPAHPPPSSARTGTQTATYRPESRAAAAPVAWNRTFLSRKIVIGSALLLTIGLLLLGWLCWPSGPRSESSPTPTGLAEASPRPTDKDRKDPASKVTPFTAIEFVRGLGQVRISQTGREEVKSANEQLGRFRVENGTLSLEVEGPGVIPFEVQVKKLTRLQVGEGGFVEAKGITTDLLVVEVQDGGSLTLRGKAEQLNLTVTGNGTFSGEHFPAETVNAKLYGDGQVVVYATHFLTGNISSGATLEYLGSPGSITHTGRGRVVPRKK
jgi:serine/threonine-protein kinase